MGSLDARCYREIGGPLSRGPRMPTEEQDSWLSNAFGFAADKLRSAAQTVEDDASKAKDWVAQKVDEVKADVSQAESWATTQAANVVADVKQGAAAVQQNAGALKAKALGDQSGKPVPRPMEADCQPQHGYVPGPKNHLLCATHGHVIDTDQGMIIAESVASYVKQGAASVVSNAGSAL